MSSLVEVAGSRDRPTESVPRFPSSTGVAYVGQITAFGPAVFIRQDGIGRPLRLGEGAGARAYAWGRTGPRAREVSRAILIDATGNEMLAERLCRPFTWEVLSGLPPGGFQLRREEVLAWTERFSGNRLGSILRAPH